MNVAPIQPPETGIVTYFIGIFRDWGGILLGSGALSIVARMSSARTQIEASVKQNAFDIAELKRQREGDVQSHAALREAVARLPTRQEVSEAVTAIREDIRNLPRS